MSATAQTTPTRAAVDNELTVREARALVRAQARYTQAKRDVDAARDARDKLIDKLEHKLELGKWVVAAGFGFRLTLQQSGQRFSLSEYLKRHKLTKDMEPFVSESTENRRLWIEPRGA